MNKPARLFRLKYQSAKGLLFFVVAAPLFIARIAGFVAQLTLSKDPDDEAICCANFTGHPHSGYIVQEVLAEH